MDNPRREGSSGHIDRESVSQDNALFDYPKDIPAPVARRAVEWLIELQSDDSGFTRQALRQWLDQHPDHARAWDHIEAVNSRLRSVGTASSVAHATLLQPGSAKRRAAVKTLAVLLFASGGTWIVRDELPWRGWIADERTGVGERRHVQLADGTTVDLNTDSAINIRFSTSERRLQLLNGEILIATGKESGHLPSPFVVETAYGELRPVGTRFMVRQQEDACRVDIFEGAVVIHPGNGGGPARTLHANEKTRFTRNTISDPVPANDADIAWTEGWLVVSDASLSSFLFELDRYRPGHLGCDPAVAQLRVSGSFPLNDIDRILDILRNTLPIEIHFLTRYWVTVRPKPS